MNWLIIILIAALALSVLKAALPVMLVLLLLALLWAICRHPRETLSFLGLLILGMVLQDNGLAVLSIVGLLGFIVLVRRPVNEETPADDTAATLLLEAPAEKEHRDST